MRLLMISFIVVSGILFTSCNNNHEKDAICNSLTSNLNINEKLRLLILYSDEADIQNATRQVARTIGCTKSSVLRIIDGETLPSMLMQTEVDNVFRETLRKKSLKSLDKTLTFWDRNILLWHKPDTTDLYTTTINPLYEVIP